MVKSAFTRPNLSDVSVIMTIMRVLIEELLYQTVMRQITVLECMLSGAHRHLWLCSIMASIKWCCFPRPLLQGHLPGTGELLGVATEGLGVC
jgi:hypothetical protein